MHPLPSSSLFVLTYGVFVCWSQPLFDTMSSDYNVCCGEVQDIIQDADCLYQQLLELALLPSSYDFCFTWYLIRSLYKLLTDRKKQYNPKLRSVLIPFT